MLEKFPVLHGSYLRDLLNQPRAILDTFHALNKILPLPERALRVQRIVLTGMGSSYHALHSLQIELVRAGRTSLMVETAELVYSQPRLLDETTLVIAVSQSGQSAETVQLLDRIAEIAKPPMVIGVTNASDSPLAGRADFAVPLVAGAEFSVSCKTYLATLVALRWLSAALCGTDWSSNSKEFEAVGGNVEGYLAHLDEHVQYLVEFLRDMRHLFLTGRGASLAAVGTGALILKESTRFHAEGMSGPSFRHGPLEMVHPGLLAIVFEGEQSTASLNQRLVSDIENAGGKAVLVGANAKASVFRLPQSSPSLRPILEMLPVQMMSLAMAALAGREPGLFTHATKVTATE